jgi:predicted DNA-binding ribbon-helix-helix protein
MSSPTTESSTEKHKTVHKRSMAIAGRKTSFSLEDAFWKALREIADDWQMTISSLVSMIDRERQHQNLSSAIRLFVLNYYQRKSVAEGEPK